MVMPKMSRIGLPSTPKSSRISPAMMTPRVAKAKRCLAVLCLVRAAKMKAISATPTVANRVAKATRNVVVGMTLFPRCVG
ncbi:hypothetical protein D3C72_2456700 [compost metagenome]